MANNTERFIQFGTGGFLRGFADWMIQKLHEKTDFQGSVVVVQSTQSGVADQLMAQSCRYTHILRGAEGVEKTTVDCISRCVKASDPESYLSLAAIETMRYVISNTTEAGIVFDAADNEIDVPNISFPGKVTVLLKRRFDLGLPGFVFLPCELIDRNGDALKDCILRYARLWDLGEDFCRWVETENTFCSTLVDRINTGYPKDALIDVDWDDRMVNTSEFFHLWVIETELDLFRELPFDKAGLNVIVTKDALEMYRTRKVRILNGAHTSLVPYALLQGFDTVKSCMDDEAMSGFLRGCIFEEIIPTLDLPRQELEAYAADVLQRFANPYIRHYLSSIALNSVSKFKVRVLPSILEYKKRFGSYPPRLLFAFRKLLEFYKTDMVRDDPQVCEYMKSHSAHQILANTQLWDQDLTHLEKELCHAHP